jgi:hypothetical protein
MGLVSGPQHSNSQFKGRPYGLTFDWSDDRIYRSELVWNAHDRALGIHVGTLQTIRDFNLSDPAVRTKMRERYGDHVPCTNRLSPPSPCSRPHFWSPLAEQ